MILTHSLPTSEARVDSAVGGPDSTDASLRLTVGHGTVRRSWVVSVGLYRISLVGVSHLLVVTDGNRGDDALALADVTVVGRGSLGTAGGSVDSERAG